MLQSNENSCGKPPAVSQFLPLGGDDDFSSCVPQLVEELLLSDRAYFRAAALVEADQGCQIAYMPGMDVLAAGCVVQVLSLTESACSVFWLRRLEKKLMGLGFRHSRIYQQHPNQQLEKLLLGQGYARTAEVALLNLLEGEFPESDGDGEADLHPLRSEQDWMDKLELHRSLEGGPDGHSSQAESWVAMERQKCEAGYMEPYLVKYRDKVCGVVNLASGSRIGRLKNLVIAPHWRRNGIGVEVARKVAHIAWQRGNAAAGCFALASVPSLRLYQQAGYRPVGSQIEWFKKLV